MIFFYLIISLLLSGCGGLLIIEGKFPPIVPPTPDASEAASIVKFDELLIKTDTKTKELSRLKQEINTAQDNIDNTYSSLSLIDLNDINLKVSENNSQVLRQFFKAADTLSKKIVDSNPLSLKNEIRDFSEKALAEKRKQPDSAKVSQLSEQISEFRVPS